jgi:D-3-phosphoglycerate dehydrogenase
MSFHPNLVFFRYTDRPGIVGIAGTLLGEAGVNIAHMEVARESEGGEAVMALAVDSLIPEDVLDQIKRKAELRDAKLIAIGD